MSVTKHHSTSKTFAKKKKNCKKRSSFNLTNRTLQIKQNFYHLQLDTIVTRLASSDFI